MPVEVPVVLIVFNRPACTSRLLEALARHRPATLFVVADGPRRDRRDDLDAVRHVRQLIDKLPWRCEVSRSLADENMGCRKRVSTGLNWVFEQVPEAIILEDDILPGDSFFRFTEELLQRYRDEPRVGSISATDFAGGRHRFTSSYAFSRYNLFWGWATWRRAWRHYDDAIDTASPGGGDMDMVLRRTFALARERLYWRTVLRRLAAGKIDSWGYRWLFSCWKANLLGVQPACSLVTNIGIGHDATHTRYDTYSIGPVGTMPFPLVHPPMIAADRSLDRRIEDMVYSRSLAARAAWLWKRLTGASR